MLINIHGPIAPPKMSRTPVTPMMLPMMGSLNMGVSRREEWRKEKCILVDCSSGNRYREESKVLLAFHKLTSNTICSICVLIVLVLLP